MQRRGDHAERGQDTARQLARGQRLLEQPPARHRGDRPLNEPDVPHGARRSQRKGAEGYNFLTDKYEDLIKAGVVDPKKVTRTALQNAASIASLADRLERIAPPR